MRATLDWSYGFLPELERLVLRRLGIFSGAFSLEAASTVAASKEIVELEVAERIANLVAKSLVAVDLDGAVVRYRLLETTRAYALEKLTESGEFERLARRHAEFYWDLADAAESESGMNAAIECFVDYELGSFAER
jgi:predicted ATPase